MTVRQMQLLLAYLDYAPGAADGILGSKTAGAIREFQQEREGCGTDTGEELRKAVAEGWVRPEKDFWDGIRYFQRQEFACKCGKCGGFPAEPEERLVGLAEEVRVHYGQPMTVSSGVRCRAHNARVGGVAASRHLAGKAMDFALRGKSAQSVLGFVRGLEGVRYAYAIDGNYVHMDVE